MNHRLQNIIFLSILSSYLTDIDYYFIVSPEATIIMNSTFPEMENQSVKHLTDISGKPFSEYYKQVKQTKSDAVVTYNFNKANTPNVQYEKTAYIKCTYNCRNYDEVGRCLANGYDKCKFLKGRNWLDKYPFVGKVYQILLKIYSLLSFLD